MPAMGFLEHLEELRKRIVYSLIAIVGRLLHLLGIRREHLRHHAASHHGRAATQWPLGQARLRQSGRAFQSLSESRNDGRLVRRLALRALPDLVLHFARPLPQREALRHALHGLDHSPVPLRRILRLQNSAPAGARIPDRLRQRLPADDHARRVQFVCF